MSDHRIAPPRRRSAGLMGGVLACALSGVAAQAQPFDCGADAQAACTASLTTQCLEVVGAGAERLTQSQAACSSQFESYKSCLGWFTRNCAPSGGGAEAGGRAGGGTVVNKTISPTGDYVSGDKVDTKIDQVNIYGAGATPDNPTSAIREHCFTFDGKRMCERY